MFIEEALKIREFIESHDIHGKSVLNVGSGDLRFRTYIQPYIHEHIILPLQQRQCTIANLDLYGNEGIDMRVDVKDIYKVKETYDVVLCSNVFEHIADRIQLGKDLMTLAKPGGFIIITTPRVFPYHADPLDTQFRPTIEEQHALLPRTTLVEQGYISVRAPYTSRGIRLPLPIMKMLMLGKSLRYKLTGAPINLLDDFRTVIRPWQVTYLVLERPRTSAGK